MSTYYRTQNIRFTPTSPAEETALFVKARGGDDIAREFLINNHLLYARQVGLGLVKFGALDEDEITSAANEGLMKAFDRFDHTRGVRFATYLQFFIRKAINALWKSKYSGPREHGGVPDPSVGAGQSNTPTVRGDDTARREYKAAEALGFTEHEVEANDTAAFNARVLREEVARLPEAQRKAVEHRYFGHQTATLREVGEERGYTRERARQIEKQAFVALRTALKKRGVSL